MATYTPNYNLKKPDDSDFILVTDLNDNFDEIDRQMKANSTPSWNSITGKPELYTKPEVDAALNNKVDKVSGMGLSTNDYTTAEKNKLSGIEAGAEVNVNADLNATSGDAQILNNPFSIINGMLMVTYTA